MPTRPNNASEAITQGVRVVVESRHLATQSTPQAGRYAFAYTVRIHNDSEQTVQLRSRHWKIEHGDGRVEEVQGPGVVGVQPVLRPGQAFEYTSGAVLSTAYGTMHGSYEMVSESGERFDATIARFALEVPFAIN